MKEDCSQTLISVIIPYSPNRKKNLDNTLYALSIQTKRPNEVIVVNDGGELNNPFDDNYGLDIKYIWTRKWVYGKDTVPRNLGARLAKNKHLVFIDCDILLANNCLEEYEKSFEQHPNCIILGIYDWLPPMKFGHKEIKERFHMIRDLNCPKLECDGTHNVMKDIRMVSFNSHSKAEEVFDDNSAGLACFGGNMGIPFDTFWKIGGFNDRFTPGLVDDGSFGLNAVFHKVGIVFNSDIIGLHQYHSRNIQYVIEQSKKEVPLIDKIFGLNGNNPDPAKQKSIFQLTDEVHKQWGFNPPEWIQEIANEKNNKKE